MTDINVRLHAWSTRFHLGLVLSQIACLTAGSHEPRASQRVTTWEDHSPHARNVQQWRRVWGAAPASPNVTFGTNKKLPIKKTAPKKNMSLAPGCYPDMAPAASPWALAAILTWRRV